MPAWYFDELNLDLSLAARRSAASRGAGSFLLSKSVGTRPDIVPVECLARSRQPLRTRCQVRVIAGSRIAAACPQGGCETMKSYRQTFR
jgi:hypothetical protein